MGLILYMEYRRDTAPALSRGISLIRFLAVEGQGTLEQLALRSGWPKSSTLRYLQSLEQSGVVRQDRSSKVWHLLERLESFYPEGVNPLQLWRAQLGETARRVGQCVELYQPLEKGLELIDRADPLLQDYQITARIGFRRDFSECDSTALLYFAFSGKEPGEADLAWFWRDGERFSTTPAQRRSALSEAMSSGMAVDFEFNENGVRRFSLVIRDGLDRLIGIYSVAQRLTPLAARQTGAIRSHLKDLENRMAPQSTSVTLKKRSL